jgi:hypothetical protein
MAKHSSSKVVHFKPTVRVKRVPTRSSLTDEVKSKLWISQDEWKQQALNFRDMKEFVELYPAISKDKTGMKLHVDGLESQKDRLARRSRRAESIDAVLDEQERLRTEEEEDNSFNSEKFEYRIAREYRKHANEAGELARDRGLEQARNVRGSAKDRESNGMMSLEDAILLGSTIANRSPELSSKPPGRRMDRSQRSQPTSKRGTKRRRNHDSGVSTMLVKTLYRIQNGVKKIML